MPSRQSRHDGGAHIASPVPHTVAQHRPAGHNGSSVLKTVFDRACELRKCGAIDEGAHKNVALARVAHNDLFGRCAELFDELRRYC